MSELLIFTALVLRVAASGARADKNVTMDSEEFAIDVTWSEDEDEYAIESYVDVGQDSSVRNLTLSEVDVEDDVKLLADLKSERQRLLY